MSWEKACTLDDLQQRQRVIFKKGPKQIVVIKAKESYFALDNRCPHQGYPLKEGPLDERQSILTCHWHHWKFDLNTGKCVTGGDPVRVYPVKVQDRDVWVDLRQPSPQEIQSQIFESLQVAIRKAKMGRLMRELIRLHFNHLDPKAALKLALCITAEQFSEGFSHAHAACADWLSLYTLRANQIEDQIICLTEAIDYLASSALAHPPKSFEWHPQPWDSQKFLTAIEQEDEFQAQALICGALSSEKHFLGLESVLTHAALLHYNDFGHSLIFVAKAAELIQAFGPEVEKPLFHLLVRHLCRTTREDLLPEFKTYAPALREFPKAFGASQPGSDSQKLFQKPVAYLLSWVVTEAKHTSVQALFEVLLQINAKNLLYFDATYQDAVDVSVNDSVGWLDFTHALTFAQAVWQQCQRVPQCWPAALLQLACFAGRNVPYLDVQQEVNPWDVLQSKVFEDEVLLKLLDHGTDVPILVTHWLKTYRAVAQLAPQVSAETRKYLWAALRRFLQSSYKQKHIRRKVRQNLALIAKDFASQSD